MEKFRFVLVNNRIPRTKIYCAWCCVEITDGYVKEVLTGLLYHNCYCMHAHEVSSMLAIENHARMVT